MINARKMFLVLPRRPAAAAAATEKEKKILLIFIDRIIRQTAEEDLDEKMRAVLDNKNLTSYEKNKKVRRSASSLSDSDQTR